MSELKSVEKYIKEFFEPFFDPRDGYYECVVDSGFSIEKDCFISEDENVYKYRLRKTQGKMTEKEKELKAMLDDFASSLFDTRDCYYEDLQSFGITIKDGEFIFENGEKFKLCLIRVK